MRDAEVVDTLRFENSNQVRVKGDPVGERLAKVAVEKTSFRWAVTPAVMKDRWVASRPPQPLSAVFQTLIRPCQAMLSIS